MDLEFRVEEYINRHRMLAPGMRVLVGVSGGPDSVALLDILYRLQGRLGISVVVAHLNHGLRGAEAEEDARYVRRLAQNLGLSSVMESADVAAYRKERGLSTQVAAREVRYRFFARAARETGAARVALGHHAGDQAETIVHHFLRGTGTAGLAGIPPVRAPFIRPLLAVRRQEIEAYCRDRELDPRRDPSNRNPAYTRNRLRTELLPLLEAEYNPNLINTLLRLGEICREENAYLEKEAAQAFQRLAVRVDGGVCLEASALTAVPPALGRRVIREAWSALAGEHRALDFDHVERVLELIRAATGGRRLELPRGVTVGNQAGRVIFSRGTAPLETEAWRYELQVPGRTALPAVGRQIIAEIRPVESGVALEALEPNEAVLDLDTLSLPLYVRNRRPGDVFAPQGLGGRVKLKKFMINAKVPRTGRERVPLVFDGEDRLVWVAGYRIAEFCKLTPKTRNTLWLNVSEAAAPFELC